MKQLLLPFPRGFSWIVLLLAAATIQAGPLARQRVPGEAKWLLHLDMEQFGPSQTCRILLQDPKGGERLRALLNHYRTLLGADPLKAISHITLYGEETTGNRGVALVSGAINARAVTARLASYPDYSRRKNAGAVIHRWKDPASGAALNACLYETGLLVISSDDASMDSALGTLGGSRPSLASRKTPGLALPPPAGGSFLVAASAGYAGAAPNPLKAMLLRNTSCAAIQVAESKGILDANITMDAVSTDAAFQIQQVINGLIVSAAFTGESSGLSKLAELSEVSRDDRQVSLRLHCPARDAAGLLASALLSK